MTPSDWFLLALAALWIVWIASGYLAPKGSQDKREAAEIKSFETFTSAEPPKRLTVKELVDAIRNLKPGQDIQAMPGPPQVIRKQTIDEWVKTHYQAPAQEGTPARGGASGQIFGVAKGVAPPETKKTAADYERIYRVPQLDYGPDFVPQFVRNLVAAETKARRDAFANFYEGPLGQPWDPKFCAVQPAAETQLSRDWDKPTEGLARPRNRFFSGNKHPRIDYMTNNTQSDTPAKIELPEGQNDLLLWLDFETTNLEPSDGYPLEVCAQLTTLHNLQLVLDEYHAVFPFKRATIFDDVVITMHARSGLLAECAEASGENSGMVHAADVDVFNMIQNARAFGAEGKGPFPSGRIYIAGTSAHFDLRWLKTYMPQTASLLHYRVFDVSAFELMLEAQGMPRRPKSTNVAHRSREDLKWARARYAELWQWCKDRAASEIAELAAQDLAPPCRAEQTATEIGETPRV